nr:MAG TPA: hypothetical protein [Caudoviricetes sp.]
MALYISLVILLVFTLVFMFLSAMDSNIRKNNGMFLTLLFAMNLFWLVHWCIKIFGSVYGIN